MAIDLDAIQARADIATAGPWFIDPSDGRTYPWVCQSADDDTTWLIAADPDSYVIPEREDALNDAEFIAHAREDIPKLVAELRAAREVGPDARRMADQILEEAKTLAKAMVADAEARARGIVEAAVERAYEITREVR